MKQSQEKQKQKDPAKSRAAKVVITVAVVFLVALLFGIFLGLFLKADTEISDAPFGSSEFVNKIFPNGLWDFVIQVVAFVILLIFVFFIGYKPVKQAMAKRDASIQHDLEDAKAQRKIAMEAASKKEETIEEGKREAARLVSSAKAQAEVQAKSIVEAAQQEAASTKKKADEDIALAKKKSEQETRQQIIDVAFAASSQVLGREVNSEDNERLVSGFVDDINGNGGQA